MDSFLLTILGGAVGAAFITGAFGILKWFLDRKATKADRKEDKEDEKVKQRDKDLEEINEQLSNLTIAVRILMYNQIKKDGKAYLARGFISTEELEDLLAAHTVYHDVLKGNGFLDSLMEKVKRLPVQN